MPSSSPRTSRGLAALALAGLLLVVVGCGDDPVTDGDESPTTTVEQDPGTGDESDDGVPDTPNAGPDGEVDDRPGQATSTSAPG